MAGNWTLIAAVAPESCATSAAAVVGDFGLDCAPEDADDNIPFGRLTPDRAPENALVPGTCLSELGIRSGL